MNDYPPMWEMGQAPQSLLGEQGGGGLSGLLGDFFKDPKKMSQLAAFGQALAQAGAPSTTGNHWGLGLANALGGASKAGAQFDQDKQSQMMRDLQMQQMKATLNQKADPLANFSKFDADKFTASSLQKFMTTRNPADLEPRVKQEIAPSGKVFNPYAPDPNINYGAVKPVDLGGSQAMTRPDGGIVGYMQNTPSPNTVMTNATTVRGQNLTNQRAIDTNVRIGEANQIAAGGNVAAAETAMRKEFADLPENKKYKNAIPAYDSIMNASKSNNRQADINLIYGLAKLYDPDSVVREGEYDTIAKSQAIPDWLKGQAQGLMGGSKLSGQTKAQILQQAEIRKNSYGDQYNAAKNAYTEMAKRRMLNPENIFTMVAPTSDATITSGGYKITRVN